MISHRKRRTIHGRRSKKQGFRVQVPHEHRRTGVDRGSFDARSGKQAIVVRSPDGLVEKVEELTLVRDKYPVLGLPIIRGAVTFVDSMVKGVKALMFSADYFPDEDVAEPEQIRPVA